MAEHSEEENEQPEAVRLSGSSSNSSPASQGQEQSSFVQDSSSQIETKTSSDFMDIRNSVNSNSASLSPSSSSCDDTSEHTQEYRQRQLKCAQHAKGTALDQSAAACAGQNSRAQSFRGEKLDFCEDKTASNGNSSTFNGLSSHHCNIFFRGYLPVFFLINVPLNPQPEQCNGKCDQNVFSSRENRKETTSHRLPGDTDEHSKQETPHRQQDINPPGANKGMNKNI